MAQFTDAHALVLPGRVKVTVDGDSAAAAADVIDLPPLEATARIEIIEADYFAFNLR